MYPDAESGAVEVYRRRSFIRIGIVALLIAGASVCVANPTEGLAARNPATMRSLRWQGVVRQSYDYSCGTGSIANLLLLVGQMAPDERSLIERYAALRSREEIEAAMRTGFSLQDLKLMLGLLGYSSAGVRFEPGTLPEDSHPMIVYLVVKGYQHFAVFAGIEQGLVVLHDPARGRIRLTIPRFLAEWDGSALVLQGSLGETRVPNWSGDLTRAQDTARRVLWGR